VIIGRNETDNKQAVEEIRSAGGKASFVTAELTRPEECKKAVEDIIVNHGTIHGLVNNAGVNVGVGLEKGSYEAFVQSLHKNLVHYYLVAHHAFTELKKTKAAL
jgi:L-fucose dehydrogenase